MICHSHSDAIAAYVSGLDREGVWESLVFIVAERSEEGRGEIGKRSEESSGLSLPLHQQLEVREHRHTRTGFRGTLGSYHSTIGDSQQPPEFSDPHSQLLSCPQDAKFFQVYNSYPSGLLNGPADGVGVEPEMDGM